MARRHRCAVEYGSILSLLSARPSHFTTGKTPVQLVQEVGRGHRVGPYGCEKLRPPEGLKPRTVGPTDRGEVRQMYPLNLKGRSASLILINVVHLFIKLIVHV